MIKKILQTLSIIFIFILITSCAGNLKVAGIKFTGDTEKKKEKVSIKLDKIKI